MDQPYPGHSRNHSLTPQASAPLVTRNGGKHHRAHSLRNSLNTSTTFSPTFINTSDPDSGSARVDRIEGENDFSGKRYVWIKDVEKAYIQGSVIEEKDDGNLLVQCDDGSVRGCESEGGDSRTDQAFSNAK